MAAAEQCYCLIHQNIEKIYPIGLTVLGIVVWFIECFIKNCTFLPLPSHVCAKRKWGNVISFSFIFNSSASSLAAIIRLRNPVPLKLWRNWFVFCKTLTASSRFTFCVCMILLAKFICIKRSYHITSVTRNWKLFISFSKAHVSVMHLAYFMTLSSATWMGASKTSPIW